MKDAPPDESLDETIEMGTHSESSHFDDDTQERFSNLAPGERFGNYEIIEHIARGGSATVYLAEHTKLARTVALKIISPEWARNDDFREMFTREAKSAAKLDHPNIVQTYDAGSVDDTPYIAMEFIEGGSLKDYIDDPDSKPPLRTILAIMRDIADALRYGQEFLRLTHGDIKPENILLSFDGSPHLADFGLSETTASKKRKMEDESTVIATPVYVAPEIISRQAIPGDPRPDIYSFGCMLFHLITGSPPFKETDISTLIMSHMRAEAPSLVTLVPGICRNLSDLVDETLKKNPDDRPSSWEEVRDRLSDIIDEIKSPKLHILKRHLSLVVSFSKNEIQFILICFVAIMFCFHPILTPFIVTLTLLVNYLVKSVKEPQNWLGIFKE